MTNANDNDNDKYQCQNCFVTIVSKKKTQFCQHYLGIDHKTLRKNVDMSFVTGSVKNKNILDGLRIKHHKFNPI